MKYYKADNAPINTPIWAVAYSVDNNNERHILRCLPLQGVILKYDQLKYSCSYRNRFCPYKKDKQGYVMSKSVEYQNRCYADTYEEAVELYNELVNKRINDLNQAIIQAQNDKIEVGKWKNQ